MFFRGALEESSTATITSSIEPAAGFAERSG